jgi:general secretion pathway protein J
VDARLDRMDHQRVAITFLRSVLGQISAVRRQAGMRKEGESEFFFQGAARGMQWVGIMPARFGMGGRTHFRLTVEGDALTLYFAPWKGVDVVPDWGQAQSYVIDRGVTAFALSYQNVKAGVSQWAPQWDNPKELPSAVQIQLQSSSGSWPLIAVEFHTPPATNRSTSGGAVFGGTQR